jgi:hypothetical protein
MFMFKHTSYTLDVTSVPTEPVAFTSYATEAWFFLVNYLGKSLSACSEVEACAAKANQ